VNKKILIVEDNPDSLEILGLRVKTFGYEAIKATTAKKPSHTRKPKGRT